uniref:Uncharacterized protein n=1 Tax=Rhizophora mucronata TaxID=61149 RepID=A0A2P2QLF1_RHIMU
MELDAPLLFSLPGDTQVLECFCLFYILFFCAFLLFVGVACCGFFFAYSLFILILGLSLRG